MPRNYQKSKYCNKLILRIYRVNLADQLLFSWVNAQKKIVPTITLEQAIRSYLNFFDVIDWDIESAKSTYSRLQKEYYQDCKSESKLNETT